MAIINPHTLGGRTDPSRRPLWIAAAAIVLAALALVNVAAFTVLALGYSTWDGRLLPGPLAIGVLDGVIALVYAIGAAQIWRGSRVWRVLVIGVCAIDLAVGALAGAVHWEPSRGVEGLPADAVIIALLLLPPSSRAFFRRQ